MITEMKVGDALHISTCRVLQACGDLVRHDNTLSPIEKDYALVRLYHAQCYIMLDQLKGE